MQILWIPVGNSCIGSGSDLEEAAVPRGTLFWWPPHIMCGDVVLARSKCVCVCVCARGSLRWETVKLREVVSAYAVPSVAEFQCVLLMLQPFK